MKKLTVPPTKHKQPASGCNSHQTHITNGPASRQSVHVPPRHSATKHSTHTTNRRHAGTRSCPITVATTKPNASCPPLQSSARHSASKPHSTCPKPLSSRSLGKKTKNATKASAPAVRTCACSETTLCKPSPILEEVKPKICTWLKENLKYLIINAACRYTNITEAKIWSDHIKVKKSTTSTKYRICADIFADKNVRRFPCFFNVSRATFKFLRERLKFLCPGEGKGKARCRKICVMVDDVVVRVSYPWKSKCRYNFDERAAECNKIRRRCPNAQGFIINPAVHREFGKVHATLMYGAQYWGIICLASKFDRDPSSFGRYFVREILKIERNSKLGRQKLCWLAQILGKALPELEGFAETAEKAEQYINSVQAQLTLTPYDINPELMAVMSISYGMASRIKIKDDDENNEDAKCLNFWKGRYVFSGRETREAFEGVALDTITGKVWNANMTYKDDLCPREGWNCSLTRVTGRRWKEYVEKGDYSLIEFDDENRFMLEEMEVKLSCAEGIPSRGSVLLSPV